MAGVLLSSAAFDAAACSGRAHIEIKDSGVYTLDYATLIAAQPTLSDCRADELYLLNRGKEVPLRVSADAAGLFSAGQSIAWIGTMLHGPQSWFDQYSAVNVYQLGAAPGSHARLRAVDTLAANATTSLQRTLHFEQENFMLRVSDQEMKPGEEPDVWQWAKLTPIDPKPFSFDFDLPDADLHGARTAEFTFNFRGMSNVPAKPNEAKAPDHVVEIAINGKSLAPLKWDGRHEFKSTLEVPLASLKPKGNTIVIRVPKRDKPNDATTFIVDVVMVNWFEAEFPLRDDPTDRTSAFRAVRDGNIDMREPNADVFGSDGTVQPAARVALRKDIDYFLADRKAPHAPVLARPIADDSLRSETQGFDYLIVAHPSLIDAIQPLAEFHRAHGMRVNVIDVDTIYDEFNGGIVHPSAIRDLVAWGTSRWSTKPKYLLLVGDASFDIHHDQRTNRPDKHMYASRVNPPQAEMTRPDGFWALGSTSYAEFSKQLPNRNLIPTWQYPTSDGQSASDNSFVALDGDDIHPQLAVGRLPVVRADEVKAIVDKTLAYLTAPTPGEWRRDVTFVSTSEVPSFKSTSDKIASDLVSRGFVVNNVYSDAREKDAQHYENVRETLKRDLDAGNLLVHFLGHGGQYIWRVGPIGDLFSLDDVSALKNAGRYPMVLAMTCFSAPFDHPTEDSIGERFLRESDKGAVAVFAASWSNWPNPENSKTLVEALLKPGTTIGEAILSVKRKTQDPVLVEMYNLLGDPAIVLVQPKEKLAFARSGDRWNPQLYVRVPAYDFGGDVDVDWIDDKGGIIDSLKFQARDTLFALPILDKAVQVRVYASDARDGRAAFGTADVRPPPAPPPEVKKIVAPTAPIKPKLPRTRNPKDDISDADFDAATPPNESAPKP
ncbi:MAG TPA: C25 family cysteine peptidase [Rudaea sp.]|nr:C25 family cysteine peptidase [Rudaea sp.]